MTSYKIAYADYSRWVMRVHKHKPVSFDDWMRIIEWGYVEW